MHYNRIFKTMYTFYQAFMTTKMLSGLQLQILFIMSREMACKSKETAQEQRDWRQIRRKRPLEFCHRIQSYTPDQATKH